MQRKITLKEWCKSTGGYNQLFEHSVKHAQDLPTLPSLEKRAGLVEGNLSKVGCNNAAEVAQRLTNVDNLANKIIDSGAVKNQGAKSQYWIPGVLSPNKGIRVITFEGKKQSIGPMEKIDWDKIL